MLVSCHGDFGFGNKSLRLDIQIFYLLKNNDKVAHLTHHTQVKLT